MMIIWWWWLYDDDDYKMMMIIRWWWLYDDDDYMMMIMRYDKWFEKSELVNQWGSQCYQFLWGIKYIIS